MNTSAQRLQAQRGCIIHTRHWPEIAHCYSDWVARGLPFVPMLRLVEALASSPSAAELFAATSMHDLLLSDHADFCSTDSTLLVRYLPAQQQFHFEHRAFSGSDDQKVCPESEALSTLSLFLRYKFGILFSVPVA